jgi:hypothetical protein
MSRASLTPGAPAGGGAAAFDAYGALYESLQADLDQRIGFTLLTILRLDGERLVRVHSSDLARYPAGGGKDIRGDAYLQQLVADGVPVLSADEAAVRERFFDHATIIAMGCGAVLNLPVRDPAQPGVTLGTLNLLKPANGFRPGDAALAAPWVARLAQAWQADLAAVPTPID